MKNNEGRVTTIFETGKEWLEFVDREEEKFSTAKNYSLVLFSGLFSVIAFVLGFANLQSLLVGAVLIILFLIALGVFKNWVKNALSERLMYIFKHEVLRNIYKDPQTSASVYLLLLTHLGSLWSLIRISGLYQRREELGKVLLEIDKKK